MTHNTINRHEEPIFRTVSITNLTTTSPSSNPPTVHLERYMWRHLIGLLQRLFDTDNWYLIRAVILVGYFSGWNDTQILY